MLVLKMSDLAISVILGIQKTEQLNQFLHNCIDALVSKSSSTLNNMNGDIDWSQEDYQMAGKFLQNIYRNLVTNPSYDINSELKEFGAEKIECIKTSFSIRKSEIQQAVVNECLAKMDYPVVTDYDWKLKWIIGSSSLSSLREPLLQMDFHTKHITEEENISNETINFEMNLNELRNFISEAEKCLDDLKL